MGRYQGERPRRTAAELHLLHRGAERNVAAKRRDGDVNAPTISGPTPSDAVKKPGADGTSVNDLEVRVQASKIDYVVNGTVVHSTPKTGTQPGLTA